LQWIYCGRVRRQLAAREKKADKKGKKGGRLTGEGIPRMLTDDDFYKRVCTQLAAMEEAEKEKENRRQKKQDLAAELEEWAKEVEGRKIHNEGLQEKWEKAIRDWEALKAEAKGAGAKLKDWMKDHPKPKRRDPEFVPEKVIPKPKMKKIVEGEAEEEGDEYLEWTEEEEQ
jgi:DNA-binding FrmR family transcriptional regulator